MKSIKELKTKTKLTFKNGKTYDATYIVGCDGARSFMRHHLNYKFGGSTVDEKFFVADTVIKSKVINDKQVYIKFGDKSF